MNNRRSGSRQTDAARTTLEHTGERMVPEQSDPMTFWEHIYRYRFAAQFVRGQRVLDIACGEGYGTAALASAGAARVVGIDLDESACAHARDKYHVDARPGRAEQIPLPDGSVDVIVSFETIEHVEKPEVFLDECRRVLAAGGQLIISTPNRDVFHQAGRHNDFHCSEMTLEEFQRAVRHRFDRSVYYSQVPQRAAWWSPRSLAAVDSPWFRPKGCWRVREAARTMVCRHIRGAVPEEFRLSPVRAVLAHDRPLASLFNPYVVRSWSPESRERPLYVIAVAQR